jgi:hypothetical protein
MISSRQGKDWTSNFAHNLHDVPSTVWDMMYGLLKVSNI